MHICSLFLANIHFSCDKYSFSAEVPIRDVVVKGDAFGAAEHGDNLHDIFLLLWIFQGALSVMFRSLLKPFMILSVSLSLSQKYGAPLYPYTANGLFSSFISYVSYFMQRKLRNYF